MREYNYVLNKQQITIKETPSDYDMFCLFQVYRLVAHVEKSSMFRTPCHARREDSLTCDTKNCEM